MRQHNPGKRWDADVSAAPAAHDEVAGGAPGILQAMMAAGGNQVMVQLAAGGDGSDVHAAAAAGTSGGGGAMPHSSAIQASFGRHDVSGISAHTGADAQAACSAIGAQAYATGNDVAFASTPSLHTAAHEAAHVVQQQGGVSLKGGVGRAGDPYEVHADAVADKVVRGESAEGLLNQYAAGGGGGEAVQGLGGDLAVQAEGGLLDRATDAVASWGADRISDASTLLQYLGSVGERVAQPIIRQLAQSNQAILTSFLRANPTHQMAAYIAAQIDRAALEQLLLDAGVGLSRVLMQVAQTAGYVVDVVVSIAASNLERAVALVEYVGTDLLPAILNRAGALAARLLNEWWPENTGVELTASLTAGVKVPVWPEPPIEIGGSGQAEFGIKLYNKAAEGGGPVTEFTVENKLTQTASAAVKIPGFGGLTASGGRSLATSLKATTRFGEVNWNVGLIAAMRAGNMNGAFRALVTAAGDIANATQIEATIKVETTQGVEASVGLGDVAQAKVNRLLGLGLAVTFETPNTEHEGKIEAVGTMTASMGGQIGVDLGSSAPSNLGPLISYLLRNANAGASGGGGLEGKVALKIPRGAITEMAAPTFDYIELAANAQAAANIAQESGAVAARGAIRFSRESLAGWTVPDLTDGMTAAELSGALPFSQLSFKGSVTVTSGLVARGLQNLVAGDSSAVRFFVSNPTVSGKVEVELKFTKASIITLLTDLGIVSADGGRPNGAAQRAIDALMSADVAGFFAALAAAGHAAASFMTRSVDTVTVEVRGTETRETPAMPIEQLELGASASVAAVYSRKFLRSELGAGARELQSFVRRALPSSVQALMG